VLYTAAAFTGILMLATAVGWWLAVKAMQAESWANTRHQEAVAAGEQAVQERDRADEAAKGARSAAAEARQALDRLSVEQGIRLADNDDLFTALLWFAKPLERGGLAPEDERIHRTRFACYLRHTRGRPVLQQMLFHEGKVNQLVFSPDARKLLTATGEAACVWDLDTGRRVAALERSKGVGQLRFMDGRRATGLDGITARTWDTTTGRLLDSRIMDSEPVALAHLLTLPHSPLQALGSVALCNLLTVPATSSPDGRLHLRVSGNHAWLCDLATGKRLHSWSFPGLGGLILHSAFSADAHRVLLAAAKQARVYDTKTGEPVGPALLPGDEIVGARVSSDGSRVVLLSGDGIEAPRVSSDGSRVELLSPKRVTVWDAIVGKQIGATSLTPKYGDAPDRVVDAALSPDGRTLALGRHHSYIAPQAQARFELWNEESGRMIAAQDNRFEAFPVRFSPDGCNVIAAGKDRTDEIWDTQTCQAAGPLLPDHELKAHYEFSPDGSMVAVAHQDGIVRVWHFAGRANGDPVARSQRAGLPPAICSYTCDWHGLLQTYRVGTARSGFRGWLSQLREWLKVLPPSVHDMDVFAAASPDGKRLITVEADEGTAWPGPAAALLWDIAAGGLLGQPIEHPGDLTHVEFSTDSRFLVTASDPGPARLWDARTGKPIGAPLPHGVGVLHACFSADGSRLVTCGADGTAQVWDTATATAVGPRVRSADNINAAVLSPDGKRIATASSDGTARIWDVGTGHTIGPALMEGSALSYIVFGTQDRLVLTKATLFQSVANRGFRIWDAATQQAVSPSFCELGPQFGDVCARWDADGLLVQHWWGRMYDVKCDLRPYSRPVEDMVRLAQLHAGQRLDDQGGLTLLTTAELHALWNELHAKYPDEFTVSPEAVMAWHVERLTALTGGGSDYAAHQTEVRLHRKGLAAQMTEVNWHEDPKTCSLEGLSTPLYQLQTSSSLYRLQAAAQFGQAQGAVATVEALMSRASSDNGALYECGRIYALAAGAVQGDAALADRYAARAVALLRQAADAGYRDSQTLRQDPDLDALRGRDDFKKLLKERFQ
jgi:WD40 repeat protein